MNSWLDILAHGEKVFVAGDVVKEDKVNVNVTDDLLLKEKVMLAKELEEEKIKKTEREKRKISEEEGEISRAVLPEDDLDLQKDFQRKVNVEKLKVTSSWAELKEPEPVKPSEDDLRLENIIKPLSEESVKRIDEFFLFLKDIHNLILKPKRQEMKELQDVIAQVTNEIQEVEKKNKELEREIELLKKD